MGTSVDDSAADDEGRACTRVGDCQIVGFLVFWVWPRGDMTTPDLLDLREVDQRLTEGRWGEQPDLCPPPICRMVDNRA